MKSFLSISFKILGRLIYIRVESIVDQLLPREQKRFLHEISCGPDCSNHPTNQGLAFGQKDGNAVFVALTAAYDSVWYGGITCNMLHLLPDRHTVRMIMKLLQNYSFALTTSRAQQSRLRLFLWICPCSSNVQHRYLRSTLHNFPKACVCRRYCIASLSKDTKTPVAYLRK